MSDSRFKVVDAPALLPANDILTGTTEGPFIDTGRDLQFLDRGRVYLALSTLEEMAREAGLLTGDQVDSYAKGYAEGAADVMKEAIGERINSLVDSLGTVSRLLVRLGSGDLDAHEEPPADVADAEGAAGQGSGIAGSEGRDSVSGDPDASFRL